MRRGVIEKDKWASVWSGIYRGRSFPPQSDLLSTATLTLLSDVAVTLWVMQHTVVVPEPYSCMVRA